MILIMTAQVLFFNDFSEKDPHVNAIEQTNTTKYTKNTDMN